jgi:hypothetical protein
LRLSQRCVPGSPGPVFWILSFLRFSSETRLKETMMSIIIKST